MSQILSIPENNAPAQINDVNSSQNSELHEIAENETTPLNPEDADAHYQNGLALSHLGEHEKALEAFGQVINLNPEDADLTTREV